MVNSLRKDVFTDTKILILKLLRARFGQTGSFRVSLFIDLGCPRDLGKEWRGDLGTFMISRPI